MKNAGLEWLIAAGVPSDELEQILDQEQQQKRTEDLWEQVMGYNPLNWNEPKLAKLLKFLLTKSEREIRQFATWSKGKYSGLSPAKARQNPLLVIDLFPQAFDGMYEQPKRDPYESYRRYVEEQEKNERSQNNSTDSAGNEVVS